MDAAACLGLTITTTSARAALIAATAVAIKTRDFIAIFLMAPSSEYEVERQAQHVEVAAALESRLRVRQHAGRATGEIYVVVLRLQSDRARYVPSHAHREGLLRGIAA